MTPTTFEPDVHAGEGCPVAFLGQMVKLMEERRASLDRLDVVESQKRGPAGLTAYTEKHRNHAEDRRDDLRTAFAAHRARSLAGCLCQIAQAHALAHDLYDLLDNPEWEANRLQRAIDRLLYSVAMHLETVAGVTVEDAGVESWLPQNLNPWQAAEAHMAWMRAKNAEERV